METLDLCLEEQPGQFWCLDYGYRGVPGTQNLRTSVPGLALATVPPFESVWLWTCLQSSSYPLQGVLPVERVSNIYNFTFIYLFYNFERLLYINSFYKILAIFPVLYRIHPWACVIPSSLLVSLIPPFLSCFSLVTTSLFSMSVSLLLLCYIC